MKRLLPIIITLIPGLVFADCNSGTYSVSAYYSPLINQKKYVTGSYLGDIRLNGSGIVTASGEKVFDQDHLFLAAPPCFDFGSIVEIKDLGHFKVTDRGGAIKGKRLDLWLGYGDEGLKKALEFGIQSKEVLVDVTLDPNKLIAVVGRPNQITSIDDLKDLKFGDSSELVLYVKRYLFDMNYYDGSIDRVFDKALDVSLLNFQSELNNLKFDYYNSTVLTISDQKIILDIAMSNLISKNQVKPSDNNDIKFIQEFLINFSYLKTLTSELDSDTVEALNKFASDYGLLSSEMAMDHIRSLIVDNNLDFFKYPLQKGSTTISVRILQKLLKDLGYLNLDPTGYFGKNTEYALAKFQLRFGLIKRLNSKYAGYLGPQTRQVLNSLLVKRAFFISSLDSDLVANTDFTVLKFGDSNSLVKALQQILIDNKYLDSPFASDYFGNNTRLALQKLAISKNLNFDIDSISLIDIQLNAALNALN